MRMICAIEKDYEAVRDFYYRLTDEMQHAEFKPGWEKDVYPAQKDLKAAIRNQEYYYLKNEKEIYAGMILNHRYNEGYKSVSWSVNASDEELLVIHALGVLPEYAGRGIAKELIQEAFEIAAKNSIKTIRLDVLEGNIPAERAYRKAGFQYLTTLKMFYEDTGWTNYKVFDYVVTLSE